MRFASTRAAAAAAAATVRRYPFALASAFVAAGAAMATIDVEPVMPYVRVLLAATLGISLLTALSTSISRPGTSPGARIGPPLAAAGLLVAFFFAADGWLDPVLFRRWAQLLVASHALVAVLAWVGRDQPNGFWQFNRTLFVRFLVSGLFSAVLFAGLALALAAIDNLFGVDVDDEHYARLGIFVMFVFNTWYFLGGLPESRDELDRLTEYPGGLKIFSQYILLPLVLIYLTILTAYLGRVAITREWPSGWIGYLVSGVSVLGILALLLVHPVRNRPENRWVGTFARGFWWALLPALAMLFLAIFQRVEQYGITENRYFLTAFAVWLTGLALYFIARRDGNLAVIPWSMIVIALGTAFGPWGAYAQSRASQTERLRANLERAGLLEGDRIVPEGERPAGFAVEFDERQQISAGLSYLCEHHGDGSFRAWFDSVPAAAGPEGDEAEPAADERRGFARAQSRGYMDRLGLQFVERWQRRDDENFHLQVSNPPLVVDLREWDYALELRGPTPLSGPWPPPAGETPRFTVTWIAETASVRIAEGEKRLIDVPLSELLRRAAESHGEPLEAERAFVRHEENGVRAAVQLLWLNGRRGAAGDPAGEKGDSPGAFGTVDGMNGRVYLAFP